MSAFGASFYVLSFWGIVSSAYALVFKRCLAWKRGSCLEQGGQASPRVAAERVRGAARKFHSCFIKVAVS